MKLVLFTSHYPYGNAEEFLETEIHYLADRFDQVEIVSLESQNLKNPRQVPEGVTVTNLSKNYKPARNLVKMMNHLKEVKFADEKQVAKDLFNETNQLHILKMLGIYESIRARVTSWLEVNYPIGQAGNQETVLYSYWFNGVSYALADYKRQGFEGPVIARAHGYEGFFNRGYQPYRQFIATHLDQLAFISSTARDQFQTNMASYLDKTHAELAYYPLGIMDNSSQSLEVKASGSVPTIVSVSRVYPLKRLDLLVDALKIVAQEGQSLEWVHFGDGPDLDAIKLRATDLESTLVKVDFRGYVANSLVHAYYQTNKVAAFLNMSDMEGVPVSMMEAISYGIPVIGRNVGGIGEVCVSGQSGQLLPADATASDYADAILEIVNLSDSDHAKVSVRAHKFWQTHFHADKNYAAFVDNLMGKFSVKGE